MREIVRQRATADCGVAALATLAGIPYEDAYVAVAALESRYRGKCGLHNHQVIAAAKRLGLTLTWTRRFDLDDDEGILRVRWRGRKGTSHPGGHFVVLLEGRILCSSDGLGLPAADYLEQNAAYVSSLLKVAGTV